MRELISAREIQQRVEDLGRELSEEYAGKPLTILGVLTGSVVLLADLIRSMRIPLRVGLVRASSYAGTRTRPGKLTIDDSLIPDISGREVLVLDDIFDTGHTMTGLYETLRRFSPAGLRSAVLLRKEGRSEVAMEPDYFCFPIPDEFVVGYGLDYNDEFRHLPFIGIPDDNDLRIAGGPAGGG